MPQYHDELDFQALNVLLEMHDVLVAALVDGLSMLVEQILVVSVCLIKRDVGLVREDVPDGDKFLASVCINTLASLGGVEGKLLQQLRCLAGVLRLGQLHEGAVRGGPVLFCGQLQGVTNGGH